MEKVGKVIRRKIALGSKSEREAVLLSTPDGDFILRRMGGNPFQDPDLEQWVGQKVKGEGEVAAGSTFLARRITPVND